MKLCPRCHRPAVGWILQRADVCSPADWGRCVREPRDEWANATNEDMGLITPTRYPTRIS